MSSVTRIALRIDVDTYRGTREGVPAMLDDLASAGVRATFFFTLGPDNSGRAVVRAFTKRGFLAKMLRTNAAKMYGWKTALYGTLLPAPLIGKQCAEILRRCEAEGHEVGLHAWDHVAWQDRLARMPLEEIETVLARGTTAFAEIFGVSPRAFAAPGWICTARAFEALDACGLDYISVSRGAVSPYFPRLAPRTFTTLEIPTTLPTLDEEIGRDGTTPANYVDRLVARYRQGATDVLTVHAETEGLAYRSLFRDLLARHRTLGIETLALCDVARDHRADAEVRDVCFGEIPGRAGAVTLAKGLEGNT